MEEEDLFFFSLRRFFRRHRRLDLFLPALLESESATKIIPPTYALTHARTSAKRRPPSKRRDDKRARPPARPHRALACARARQDDHPLVRVRAITKKKKKSKATVGNEPLSHLPGGFLEIQRVENRTKAVWASR